MVLGFVISLVQIEERFEQLFPIPINFCGQSIYFSGKKWSVKGPAPVPLQSKVGQFSLIFSHQRWMQVKVSHTSTRASKTSSNQFRKGPTTGGWSERRVAGVILNF